MRSRIVRSAAGLLGLAAFTGLAGCRDLDVPPPGPGAPPVVRFVNPDVAASGARVSQTLPVTLEAQDANGIRSVTLVCGATPLFSWTSAPYVATVDLRPCTAAAGADAGTVAVTLVARAVDATGMEGSASAEVQVDASAPAVELVLPERVAPGRAFTVLVKSDRPIAGPLVSVEGVGVQAVPVDANTFSATVPAAPGLGVDTWDADAGAPPLALLEQVERPLDVAVEARGLNGNPAPRVVARTFVSRIAWERSIPGVALGRANGDGTVIPQLPVATKEGLVLPVVSAGGRSGTEWVPVLMRAAAGEVRTVPPEQLDGGYLGAGVDLLGRTLLANGNGDAHYYDLVQGTTAPSKPLSASAVRVPAAVGDELCFSQLGATCGLLELHCLRPGGSERIAQLSTPGLAQLRNPSAMVVSGGRVLVMGMAQGSSICCSGSACSSEAQDMFVDADGSKGMVTLFPSPGGQSVPAVSRALPLGGGAFALGSETPGFLKPGGVYRFGSDRAVSQPWPALASFPDFNALVSGQLGSEQLLTLEAQGATQTALARHAPGLQPATSLLPASFEQETPAPLEADNSAVPTAQGVAVLLRVTNDVGALASVDARGNPRWIYRYDRSFGGDLAVATPDSGLVYLVDLRRQRVVALYP
ncbi:hypothetical protein FGE12_06995 [Aggregicoccus sp. 17bor-14]|uniref:Ig-like domain-containing protein n=1 Tax=Myxococcaceae TaxID=31 RepID=UPI00129C11E7|nr:MULTISPECIES: Ig-like domain-containing protein [Myxococcaceae]MBF5042136.1 hypothetical protein [Simulacricoccus sp. 17bor-14]MRI87913.1 hypothetical protein [Aggregicoccus sp. 17bor-14]